MDYLLAFVSLHFLLCLNKFFYFFSKFINLYNDHIRCGYPYKEGVQMGNRADDGRLKRGHVTHRSHLHHLVLRWSFRLAGPPSHANRFVCLLHHQRPSSALVSQRLSAAFRQAVGWFRDRIGRYICSVIYLGDGATGDKRFIEHSPSVHVQLRVFLVV